MKPVIGILGSVDEKESYHFANRTYWNAILAAGGIPVLLPYAEDETQAKEVMDAVGCAGLLFAGGDDIRPEEYGETPVPECGHTSGLRDRSERSYVRSWDRTSLPCLGICRGIQTLNVFLGGSLWQDLPSQYPSALKHGGGAYHRLVPEKDSFFSKWSGEDLSVNSYHHQAIKELAPGLIPDARTEDGVIEAVRFRNHPNAFAVQFHPEKNAPESALSRALFARLADEAKKAYRS